MGVVFLIDWLVDALHVAFTANFRIQTIESVYIYIYVPLDPRAGFGWAFKRPLPPIVLYSNQEKKNSDERKTWVQNKDDLRGWLIISIKVEGWIGEKRIETNKETRNKKEQMNRRS